MLITRTSAHSGITHTVDMNITKDQLYAFENRKRLGLYVQDIVPNLSADDREFLLSGITPDEWEEMFPEEIDN